MSPRRCAPLRGRDQEATLLERLRAGDRTALSELVLLYQAELVRRATKVLGDRAQAGDVVQDTWLAVLRGASCFDGRSTLLTWLTTILLNRARSLRRKGSRVQFARVSSQIEPDDGTGTPARTRVMAIEPVTEMTAERMVLEREQRLALDAAVHALPNAQRSVVRLHLQGYDSAETREALGITDLARRLRLSRARSRLREKLVCFAA